MSDWHESEPACDHCEKKELDPIVSPARPACVGNKLPDGHIFEVFDMTNLGVVVVWHLRCVKCKEVLDAMTAIEFLMSGHFGESARIIPSTQPQGT